jgi:hypothetical protein
MSGAYDMVNRMRQNRAMRNSQRHKARRESLAASLDGSGATPDYGKTDPNGKSKVLRQIAKQSELEKTAHYKSIWASVLLFTLLLALGVFLFNSPAVLDWVSNTFSGWFR